MRKLSKTLLSLLLIAAMLASFVVLPAAAEEPAAEQPTEAVQAAETQSTAAVEGFDLSIVMLDCGRKYFSVDSIKQIIDNASAAGFGYIMLGVGNDGMRFLLDDMSLTVNGTTYESDAVKSAIHAGNEAYYNFDVDELTQTEMDAVLAYAKEKGMGVIPMLNTPGHMDAILAAATSLTGTKCAYNDSARTIDVTNSTAVAFTQAFVQKYVDYFASKGCKYFNMGADEYANDKYLNYTGMGFGKLLDDGNYGDYITYINTLANMIDAAGMTPMAFNDGIYYGKNDGYGTVSDKIVVCYWSSGWGNYSPASASYLKEKGFKLVNTHGDYYWVLGKPDAQCSASKASGFSINSFPGSTIDNPSGVMFCIWADYPGADSESNVISSTAATISAFGKTLPEVKTQEPDATVTKDNISITAPGLTGATVTSATVSEELDGKKVVSAWNIELTTENGSYTGSAAVKVPLDGKWTGCTITAGVLNEETGKVDYGKDYDIKDGFLTFTAPHFSTVVVLAEPQQKSLVVPTNGTKTVEENGNLTAAEVRYSAEGIVSLESRTFANNVTTMTFKGLANGDVSVTVGNLVYQITVTDESYSSKKTITVAVGGTATDTVDGEVSSTYTDDFVSVKTETQDVLGEPSYEKSKLSAGTFYVSTSYNASSPTVKITLEDAGDGEHYYVKNAAGEYVYPDAEYSRWNGRWSYSLSSGKEQVTITTNSNNNRSHGIRVSRTVTYSTYGTYTTTAYLQISGSSLSATQTGTWIYLYKATYPVTGHNTVITFSGKQVGRTQVVIGDVLYIITVSPENLDNVSPLKIEYWITNRYVSEGTTYNSTKISRSLSATEAYKSDGVALDEIIPATGTIEGGAEGVYWKSRQLPSTDKQTHTSGVDKTTVTTGTDITRVRYWGKAWQYSSDDGKTWTNFASDDQLVAYYLQKTEITSEVTTEVADWGEPFPYSLDNYVLVDYAVKYESSNQRVPNAFPINTTTQVFHCKHGDPACATSGSYYYRNIGYIRAQETADYEVYMITLTPTSDKPGTQLADNTTSIATKQSNFYPADLEKVIWVDDEANLGDFVDASRHFTSISGKYSYSVGGEPNIPGLEIYDRHGMLITYYLRAKKTPDSLTVHYIDKKANKEFYSYNIAVEAGTVFNENIGLGNPANGELNNGTVTNLQGKQQIVSANLSTMPVIGAQYRYSDYTCVDVVRSTATTDEPAGKEVFLYYTFNNSHIFVVDFGVPLKIKATDIGVTVPAGDSYWTEATCTGAVYGETKIANGEGLTYTATKPMLGIETLNVTLATGTGEDDEATHIIYLVPATTVYYEQNVATYSNGWELQGTAIAADKYQETQKGRTTGHNFGFDPYYEANQLGASGSVEYTNTKGADATLTFKGTGMELYLRTQNANEISNLNETDATNHSYMLVQVYAGDTADANSLKRMSFVDVNNLFVQHGTDKYGYNTPCWTVDGMTYGTYTVVVRYVKGTTYGLAIDGFRVTNTLNPDNATTKDFYAAVGEADMQTAEIRNMVLAQIGTPEEIYELADPMYRVKEGEVLDAVFDKEDSITGAVIIKKDGESGGTTVDVNKDLVNIGPKNEIYLNPGEAVVMTVPTTYTTVQVGMRSLTGDTVTYQINSDAEKEMKSTVDMYNKVNLAEGKLVIQNVSGGILALTRLKVTSAAATTNDSGVIPQTTPEAIRYAMALMRGIDVPQFTDVAEDAWYHDYVYDLVYRGVVNGMTATTYEPEGKLTRAQFVKLLACSLADAETLKTYEGKHPFKDSEGHWAEAYIAWAKDKGIVEGVSATKFDPEAPITREQMATIFGRYALKQGIELPKSDNAAGSFPDADKISEYAREFVELMRIAGILNGYEDGTFRPQGNATRAEAAKLFSLFLSITDKLAK